LFHGNPDQNFEPHFGGGKDYHDYGRGLYCTTDAESAKEWACQRTDISVSYLYTYELDLTGITPVIDLSNLEPAYWLSALAYYRYEHNETKARRGRRLEFIQLFPVDCERYEVIEGWRADDRYFAYLKLFLRGDISYEAVVQAMKLGGLGKQVVIKGKKAYEAKKEISKTIITGDEYLHYQKQYLEREQQANAALEQTRDIDGALISDILRKGGL
jgi:hypothetical protein